MNNSMGIYNPSQHNHNIYNTEYTSNFSIISNLLNERKTIEKGMLNIDQTISD